MVTLDKIKNQKKSQKNIHRYNANIMPSENLLALQIFW
jgi:hypothetical protein